MPCRIFYWICLLLVGAISRPSLAEIRIFSIPKDISWEEAEQPPLRPAKFFHSIDFERIPDGIVSLEPSRVAEVPDIPLEGDVLSADQWDRLFRFSRHVAQQDVVAERAVELENGQVIEVGEVLFPRLGNLPGSIDDVRLLLRAGVRQVPVLINVAESFPKTEVETKFSKNINLLSPSFFEYALTQDQKEVEFAEIFDGDPHTSFERVDRPGQDIVKKMILIVDLDRFFPLSLIRFYPKPEGLRLSAYTLRLGVPGTERPIAGLDLEDPENGNPGFPKYIKVADALPTFVIAQSVPVNRQDTAAVFFEPPRRLRYFRLDVDTNLDYDLAEMEAFADGFMPSASYVTRVLELPRSTLGRIFWEEEKIGDPSQSQAVLSFQTGLTEESEVLFRKTDFDDQFEWQRQEDGGALVVDRRTGSGTFGQQVDLNALELRLDVREIFSALSDEERLAVRLTREQYQGLPGNQISKVEPDLRFWSGFQPLESGDAINAPSGRPYFQVRIDFSSESARAATAIRNLRFEFETPLLAREAKGEIAPAADVIAGRDTLFMFALQTSLAAENAGFNRLHIRTPARIRAIESVSVELEDSPVRELRRIPLGDRREPGEDEFKEVAIEDQFFAVELPRLRTSEDGVSRTALIRVKFIGRVLDFRTRFQAHVFLDTLGARDRTEFVDGGVVIINENEAGPDTLGFLLLQEVGEGNVVNFAAAELLEDRNSLSVVADISAQGKELVDNVGVAPNPFTPNGDGVNDELVISYDILRLIRPGLVRLEVFDLTGRRQRLIGELQLTSGGYTETWDGRDENGETVPPGIYLLRIRGDTDTKESVALKQVAVIY